MRAGALACAVLLMPVAGQALELSLPGNADLTREVAREAESYELPLGPYGDGTIPSLEVEGQFLQQAWRLEAQTVTTLQILEPLRAQLMAGGYDILLDCSGAECGGFDFRFATRVLPAPDMFVDLFDYRFVSARRQEEGAAGSDYVSLMISRTGNTGYIQVIRVAPEGLSELRVKPDGALPAGSPAPEEDLPVREALLQRGHVILSDLTFESGSSDLGDGVFTSLQDLAAFLNSDATRRVALVGHTDTVGGLDPNIALSKRRATSVLERLVAEYGVDRAQLDAEGMGYLSPIAPNLTQAGREANRRVEAVLLNSE